jgi:hypothetical protein
VSDIAQALRISGRINEMVGQVFAPVALTMAREGWDGQYQAMFWQALARDAMVRSIDARNGKTKAPARGTPDDG